MQRQQMADALFHGPITLLRGSIMLHQGRFETASRLVGDWLRRHRPAATEAVARPELLMCFERLGARARQACGEDRVAMLERLLTQAMCHGWKARVCEIQAAMAEALNSQGRRRKAQSVLLDGMVLARRTGLAGIERHMCGDDASLKSWMARAASGPDEDCPDVALVQLSRRELAVLQLIALGLANREISERLHISLHTMKSHAQRINVKLGVLRRTQAIVQAKELGLVS